MKYLLVLSILTVGSCVNWHEKRRFHDPLTLDDAGIKYLADLSNEKLFTSVLDPILVPRVPGSENHKTVQKFIIDLFLKLGYSVEEDEFMDKTPVGNKPFNNIMATLDPSASRRLVLACHYDSKLFDRDAFVAATDSAVPCAMMINLAQLMDPLLKADRSNATDITLQLLFFDGEEAFKHWTNKDSLYGSRHLARKLTKTMYPRNNRDGTTELHRIDLLVLLDLLGAKDPTFYNYFMPTKPFYMKFVEAEMRLHQMGLLQSHPSTNLYFQDQSIPAGIQDDHIPFLEKGVPILHLIPVPFPDVWHKPTDNRENLDWPTIANLNKILRVTVARYLHLPVLEASRRANLEASLNPNVQGNDQGIEFELRDQTDL